MIHETDILFDPESVEIPADMASAELVDSAQTWLDDHRSELEESGSIYGWFMVPSAYIGFGRYSTVAHFSRSGQGVWQTVQVDPPIDINREPERHFTEGPLEIVGFDQLRLDPMLEGEMVDYLLQANSITEDEASKGRLVALKLSEAIYAKATRTAATEANPVEPPAANTFGPSTPRI